MSYKRYGPENLDHALVSVRNGEMTAYKASKVYKVPYQTLLDKLKNRHTNPSGHATVLTKEEEELIVKWIHHMAEIGFPVTKEQLLHSVSKLVRELSRPNPFKDGIPGRHWYESFLKRNPNVSSRVCQALTTARVGATEEKIRHWFDSVYKYLEENNCLEILQDPSRIFNCDESAFFLCPKGQAVLARRGQKSVYCRSGNDEKENLTLSLGASADGKLMPILALFPYKRIPMNILQKYPKTWVIGKSDNGWMTCQTFYEYIANSFNGFLLKENIKKPVLLFLDGHVSHLSLPLTTFCKENGIILVALLPNSTHALQPMDVAVFHALKNSWKKSVHDWRMANNAKKLGREDFGPILEECIQRTLNPEILINGFRHAGLFPFDQNAINYDKLLKSSNSSNAGSTRDSCSDTSTPFDDEKLVNHERTSKQLEKTSVCPSNSKQFISEFEKLLGIEKLRLFKDCDGVWQGDIKDTNLFYFWKKVNGCNDDEVEIGDSTLKANDCTLNNIEENTLNFDNYNIILEGIVENYGTVTLTPHLTLSSPTPVSQHTANCIEKSSRSPSKGSELAESDDDLRFSNFNPVLNSTPTTKFKEAPEVTALAKPSQHENLSSSQETLSMKPPVKSFTSDYTTLSAHQYCETSDNIFPEANLSCLNRDSLLNNTFTANTKSKELKLLPEPAKLSQIENLTPPKQTFALKSSVSSNCITPPAQQSSETNENVLSEGNALNTDTQAKQSVTDSNTEVINITKKSQFPTPFKKSFLWPETEITKKTNKKVKKSLIPTIATSTEYIEYQRRLDQDKKEKIEKADLRKKEREEKSKAKLTAKLNKNKDTDSETNKKKKVKTKSKKTCHSEAAQSLESENITEEIKENKTSTKGISFKTGDYVVVTYEGENFPGLITKVSEGASKTYDVKTMTMSGLDTITGRVNWRWPEKDDILTYDSEDVVKKIKAPIPLNKRGVCSVAM